MPDADGSGQGSGQGSRQELIRAPCRHGRTRDAAPPAWFMPDYTGQEISKEYDD